MAKIRKLSIFDTDKIRKILETVGCEPFCDIMTKKSFTPFPLSFLHDILPVKTKFLQESYVIDDDGSIIGVVSIQPDGYNKKRWKINSLILTSNAYDAGKQLIDYVISKYGALGIETFITIVDEKHEEAIALFKEGCGFRSCNHIKVYKNNIQNISKAYPNDILFRLASKTDAKALKSLEEQELYPHFRPSLLKSRQDFISVKLQNFKNNECYVLENPKTSVIEGYFIISSDDNSSFWLDIRLSLPYQDYYADIIEYAANLVSFRSEKADLYIFAKMFYQSSGKLLETLEQKGFERHKDALVLVKDYWKPIKALGENGKSSVFVFPDIAKPACNFVENKDTF